MKQYNRYKFKSGAPLVKGERPNLFALLTENVDKTMTVLDLGCGSGELTLKLSRYCKKIIGIDCFAKYIDTANLDKKSKKITNVVFKVGDAQRLPFKDNHFDLIYSSRGPLSASEEFLNEAVRVLKKGGILIEETIGESDKVELKRIFKRGQNFPYTVKREDFLKKLLDKCEVDITYLKNFVYYQKFASLSSVVRVLGRTPIIPDFDRQKDKESLKKIELLGKSKGIVLSAHRLLWVGKKRE